MNAIKSRRSKYPYWGIFALLVLWCLIGLYGRHLADSSLIRQDIFVTTGFIVVLGIGVLVSWLLKTNLSVSLKREWVEFSGSYLDSSPMIIYYSDISGVSRLEGSVLIIPVGEKSSVKVDLGKIKVGDVSSFLDSLNKRIL